MRPPATSCASPPAARRRGVTPLLNGLGGIAFGADGKRYVSINSNQVGVGQVVLID